MGGDARRLGRQPQPRAYRRLYGFRHLRADCQGPGSAPKPDGRTSIRDYFYLYLLLEFRSICFAVF